MKVLITLAELNSWASDTISGAIINENAKTCFELMKNTGCRSGETRQERWRFVEDDLFELETEKRNFNRLISESQVPSNFITCIINRDMKLCLASYSTIKFWLERCQPFTIYNTQKECSTHAFRHLFAKNLKEEGYSMTEIQVIMGEKYIASVYQYVFSELYKEVP